MFSLQKARNVTRAARFAAIKYRLKRSIPGLDQVKSDERKGKRNMTV